MFEDGNPQLIAKVEKALSDGTITRDHFYMKSGARMQNIASIAFGGADLRTAYLGSLAGDTLPMFQAPVAGLPLPHWTYGDSAINGAEVCSARRPPPRRRQIRSLALVALSLANPTAKRLGIAADLARLAPRAGKWAVRVTGGKAPASL